MGALETALRAARADGRKVFAPYVTGGYPGVDPALLRSLADAGADAIEVGIPHSDPIMDGGVIQQASADALAAGATLDGVLSTVRAAALPIPVAVMTYANPVLHRGAPAFLEAAAAAGVSGAIVPDLPVDEAGTLTRASRERGIDLVLLAAPGTSPDRLAAIADASAGFVYCVATYGVTGVREELAETAAELVAALRPRTDLPLLVGVGIGTPEAAVRACAFADGVVVGSAMMRALVDGGPAAAVSLAATFRAAIG
jgi:tryptophan synthase alpha chain